MCGVRMLSDSSLFEKYSETADQLILEFIRIMEEQDEFFPTLSVHQIVHLGNDVRYHKKPLETFACYKFENTLKTLKARITNFKNPLKNLANRLRIESTFESNSSSRRSRGVKQMIGEYDILGMSESNPNSYHSIQCSRFYLTGVDCNQSTVSSNPDSYFITKQNTIYLLRSVSVHAVNKTITLEASKVTYRSSFEFSDRFGQLSFSSSQCGVFVLRELKPTLSSILVSDVYRKLIVNSSNGVHYAYTLIA